MRSWQARRSALVCAAIAALALAAPVALGDATYPEFDLYAYDQTLGGETDIDFDFVFVSANTAAETLVATAPTGYSADLTGTPGTKLGYAEIATIPSAGGAAVTFKGSANVVDPASFATDPVVQACVPGTHTAAWNLVLTGPSTVVVPIAVDQLPDGGSYRLTICLDPLRAAGLKPTEVYFGIEAIFKNPSTPDTYWWRTLVTPLDAVGVAAPTAAYEMIAAEPIPETLTIKPTFSRKRHSLTLRGRLYAARSVRTGVRVHLFVGSSLLNAKELGVVETDSAGRYVLQVGYAKNPGLAYAHVNTYHGPGCLQQPSSAPGGCASNTTDGTDSPTTKIVLLKK